MTCNGCALKMNPREFSSAGIPSSFARSTMNGVSIDEASGILAHELAHYKGNDTEFSSKFYPLYRGTLDALGGLAAVGPALKRRSSNPAGKPRERGYSIRSTELFRLFGQGPPALKRWARNPAGKPHECG